MTALELRLLLTTAGISQYELARRLGITQRAIVGWLQKGYVPPNRVESVKAAVSLKPKIYLSRDERIEVAELLDGIVQGMSNAGQGELVRKAARYRDKIRASVGGYVASA